MTSHFSDSLDEDLGRALAGDDRALGSLLDQLTPVVQACVARTLLERAGGSGRDVRQEVADMTQEVFVRLLIEDAKALRAWVPERSLSLKNFVALLARRHVAGIMRAKQRNPWSEQPMAHEDLHVLAAREPGFERDQEQQVVTRDMLDYLLLRLEEELSPLGWQVFELLFVKELEVTEVCETLAMKTNAVYTWRNRLIKLSQRLFEEAVGESEEPSGRRPPRRKNLRKPMVNGVLLCQLAALLTARMVEVHG